MVVIPLPTPESMPVLPIVATLVAELIQEPPEAASVRVIVCPWQTLEALITGARELTLTVVVALHPDPRV
jgi:hypothetical protein